MLAKIQHSWMVIRHQFGCSFVSLDGAVALNSLLTAQLFSRTVPSISKTKMQPNWCLILVLAAYRINAVVYENGKYSTPHENQTHTKKVASRVIT